MEANSATSVVSLRSLSIAVATERTQTDSEAAADRSEVLVLTAVFATAAAGQGTEQQHEQQHELGTAAGQAPGTHRQQEEAAQPAQPQATAGAAHDNGAAAVAQPQAQAAVAAAAVPVVPPPAAIEVAVAAAAPQPALPQAAVAPVRARQPVGRAADLFVAGLIQPADAPGVPVEMQDRHTAWLLNVRCCRMARCPLCSHRRRGNARAMLQGGRADQWPHCAECACRLPPTAMQPCGQCGQTTCALCCLKRIAAAHGRNLQQVLGTVTCFGCRNPKTRLDLYRSQKYYMAHRQQINDAVPRLWERD